MASALSFECQVCGFVGLDDGDDGFFYCGRCGSQAAGVRDTAVDDDDMLLTKESMGATVQRRQHVVNAEPLSQSQPPSQFWESLRTQDDDAEAGDGVGPTEPSDFGKGSRTLNYEDYYEEIRLRYVMGVQIMIELQVKALVEKFNVCPIIVGMVEPIWLRFVASTKLLADEWADEVINESESQLQGETDVFEPRFKHKSEPHNILGKRSVMIWYHSMSKTIPLYYSLAISFLVCHLAREPILPTDIVNWTLEGKLPYFAAFLEIEKEIGPPSNACPLTSSRMFRPIHGFPIQKLESLAASIADSIGLELPPVNFYAIASCFLKQLSLPIEIILPHACRIYEWSMPPELWLSTNEYRLPTRACVMAILVVSIRVLYKIHGFGMWEMSLSRDVLKSSMADKRRKNGSMSVSDVDDDDDDIGDSSTKSCNLSEGEQPNMDSKEILLKLESKYNELVNTNVEHSKDLQTYLQYCKDVIFAGVELSFEDYEEEQIIEDLWDFYQKKEDEKPLDSLPLNSSIPLCSPQKRPRDNSKIKNPKIKKSRDIKSATDSSESCSKEQAIKRMISNMEENRFCYIPPRVKVKRFDYLHYTRKKDEGAYTYAAHADYYILLRSCAKVAQLDVRNMHSAVLTFERRLTLLEKNIDYSLKVKHLFEACELCRGDDEDEVMQNNADDSVKFSKLNL